MEQFDREFRGIWIPAEIWSDERLSAVDKMIFAEIHSLDTMENGCYASNQYLAEFCHCSVRSVQTTISKLKELGMIEIVSFDGRKRVMKSMLSIAWQTRKICVADTQNSAPDIYNIYNNNKKRNIIENNSKEKENYKKKKKSPIDYQEVVTLYNDTCVSLPKVTRLSDARKRAIKTVLDNYTLGDLQIAFEKVEASDFLTGRNNKWKANFDWLMKDTNLTKVLDGNYDNKTNGLKYDWSKI